MGDFDVLEFLLYIYMVLCTHSQFLHVKFVDGVKLPWFFTALCGSLIERHRLKFFSRVRELVGDVDGPWLLSNDFNDFMSLFETSSFGPHVSVRYIIGLPLYAIFSGFVQIIVPN